MRVSRTGRAAIKARTARQNRAAERRKREASLAKEVARKPEGPRYPVRRVL